MQVFLSYLVCWIFNIVKTDTPIIEIKGLMTRFGQSIVHENLDLTVYKGEVLGIVGGSGSGKTTLLRQILMLNKPAQGSIHVFGKNILTANYKEQASIRRRWGVAFQQNALFSSLTLLENVCFPLKEFTELSPRLREEIGLLKIKMAQLPLDAAQKYPTELSGGMAKRGALARAIVQDAELLFLDEPTAGLDPQSAGGLDDLVINLRATLGLTIVIVTHDLDTLWQITDRVAFIGEKRVIACAHMNELTQSTHPLIQAYFRGPRARAANPNLIAKNDGGDNLG